MSGCISASARTESGQDQGQKAGQEAESTQGSATMNNAKLKANPVVIEKYGDPASPTRVTERITAGGAELETGNEANQNSNQVSKQDFEQFQTQTNRAMAENSNTAIKWFMYIMIAFFIVNMISKWVLPKLNPTYKLLKVMFDKVKPI